MKEGNAVPLLLLFLGTLGCGDTSGGAPGWLLASEPYVDPKGFFSVIPPEGWRIQEYPDDPRGKVSFQLSTSTSLSILTNGVDYSTFAELQDELREATRRAGLEADFEVVDFHGVQAVEREFTIQGSRVLMLDFLDGSVAHNLMYTAPSGRYDDALAIVRASLASYDAASHTLAPADQLEHELAKHRRLGRLFIDLGQYDEAVRHINLGLEHSESDRVLLDLRDEAAVAQTGSSR